jgi:hypothetical protein
LVGLNQPYSRLVLSESQIGRYQIKAALNGKPAARGPQDGHDDIRVELAGCRVGIAHRADFRDASLEFQIERFFELARFRLITGIER